MKYLDRNKNYSDYKDHIACFQALFRYAEVSIY